MAADAATYGPREGLLAPLPAAERGVAVVLGASPDGKYLVYGSGTSVVVRSIDDPALCVVYSEHTAAVKVAKFAPTGKYIASGGECGAGAVGLRSERDARLGGRTAGARAATGPGAARAQQLATAARAPAAVHPTAPCARSGTAAAACAALTRTSPPALATFNIPQT